MLSPSQRLLDDRSRNSVHTFEVHYIPEDDFKNQYYNLAKKAWKKVKAPIVRIATRVEQDNYF